MGTTLSTSTIAKGVHSDQAVRHESPACYKLDLTSGVLENVSINIELMMMEKANEIMS